MPILSSVLTVRRKLCKRSFLAPSKQASKQASKADLKAEPKFRNRKKLFRLLMSVQLSSERHGQFNRQRIIDNFRL